MARDSLEGYLLATLPGTRSITITVGAAGPVTITLATASVHSYTVAGALSNLQDIANADATIGTGATGRTYAFSRSLSAQTVTFAATGGNFDLVFIDSMHTALGFASKTGHTGAASYASDVSPRVLAQIESVGFSAPQIKEEGRLTEVRHGRSFGNFYAIAAVTKFELIMSTTQWDTLRNGPLLSGRVRIRGNNGSSDFGPSNLGGYHDVFLTKHESTTLGMSAGFVKVTMEASA